MPRRCSDARHEHTGPGTDYRVNSLTAQTRRLARNISWLLLQELALRVLGLATAIYLARVLSAQQYGELGLALALIGILSTLVEAGTGSRATRLTALDASSVHQTYAQITGMRLTLASVLMVTLIAAAPALSRIFSFPPTLLVLCAFLLVRPALAVFWAFRGLDRMHVNAIAAIAEKLIAFTGLLLLVHGQTSDVLWIPVIETVAALLMVTWLRVQLGHLFPGLGIALRVREWPEIARESMPLSLAALLGSVYLHGAVLMLGWLGNTGAAAEFLIAQKLMLTLAVLWYVISRSVFPSASRLLPTDAPAALALVADLLRYYLAVIVALGLLLGLFANEVLALLFGATYADSGAVLLVLLAALPFLAVSHSLLTLLRARPLPRAVLAGRITSALVLLAVAALLIPAHGAIGAAVAVVAGEAAAMLLLFYLANKALGGVPWNRRCAVPLVAGAVAALLYVMLNVMFEDWGPMLGLPVATCAYGALLLLLRGISWRELGAVPALLASAVRRQGGRDA